jgi:hypothetical protein
LKENEEGQSIELRTLTLNSSIQLVHFGNHTMIEFPDQQSFDNLVLELDSIQEDRDDKFLAMNSSLSDEELDSLEIAQDYKYKQPCIDFENQLNFTNSYRSTFEQGEEEYLDSVSTIDPEDLTIMDETEHSLINDKQRVKIGNSIFQFLTDGYVEITDSFESNLNLIDRFGVDNVNSSGIIVHRVPVCRWWVGDSDNVQYNGGTHKVKIKVVFRGLPLNTRVKSKIVNYRRKGGENGK